MTATPVTTAPGRPVLRIIRSGGGGTHPSLTGSAGGQIEHELGSQTEQITGKNAMDYVGRPELDAKLETIEARMDGRLARIEDKFAAIDRQFGDVRSLLSEQRSEQRLLISEQKSTAWKAAGAVIGSLGVMFGIYVAAFDSGRDTAKLAAEAQSAAEKSQRDVAKLLQEMQTTVKGVNEEAEKALTQIRKSADEINAARDVSSPPR
ncbi:hypothetical protein [Neopusillimonas aromaticivorans]|uniref:hypothetical protein n=1 Tax=Neopusillimonas aromaticivorans TaxID=2979868 RepID=UPI002599AC7E|nr:hypothetical protein [Neopusillimonas aromaticivorans]WJJ94025.1 hypothetical protein N7E01_02265 [Neopusillimonas aromaticivorans]